MFLREILYEKIIISPVSAKILSVDIVLHRIALVIVSPSSQNYLMDTQVDLDILYNYLRHNTK